MKVALLSDIHGNHLALAAVLIAAKRHGVERLLIAGDLVGYYFWPKEVLELLALWDKCVVRGNHEDMLAKARKQPVYLKQIEQKYGVGIRVALDTLTTEQLDWLENLPHPLEVKIDDCKILLCHGAPWDVDLYVYPEAERVLLEKCADTMHDWIVLGHTHYPMKHRIGSTTIINPGSVGQSRNRKPGAHWALLDTRTKSVELCVETYNMSWVIDQSKLERPNLPYLWEVLSRT